MIGKRTRNSATSHSTASTGRKKLGLALIALVLAGALAAGVVGYLRWSTPPTAVALINTDTGPLGARIAKALQDSGTHDWDVVDEASTADYAVVVTLPADLTTSVASLVTDKPQRAQVTATTHRNADADLVNDATNEVTRQISAAGMDALFTSMTAARGQVSQVAFTASLLGAGVGAAADAAGQFSGGADQMLSFLETAKSGASQLTSAIAVLNSTVSAATTQANQLANALDATGVTVGQVEGSATSLSAGLNTIVPLLQALPFAGDPQLANIITQLQGLQTIADQAGGQLSGFGEIVGTTVTPDTQIGTLLRDAATRLGDASAQLNQGAQLAAQIPDIADQGAAQLLAAMNALTTGVSQLQSVTTTLNNQTNQALATLPQRSGAQSSQIAITLADPVEVVRK